LHSQLQKGIFKQYETHQDNIRTLKGKYLIKENIKFNFTKDKIYCEFDDFSEDNELNQFFLYAIKTLINFTKNKMTLRKCEIIFDEVSLRKFDINNMKFNFNRLNDRFKSSFTIALFVLQKFIPMFESHKHSFSFLFDMNELFEKFIGNIYKDTHKNVNLQAKETFNQLTLKPDIICDNLIIDTKYKTKDLETNDKYQMFVYGVNFKIKNTMLLYPKYINDIDDDLELGKEPNIINLKLKSIDLFFDVLLYDDYIDEIKYRVNKL